MVMYLYLEACMAALKTKTLPRCGNLLKHATI